MNTKYECNECGHTEDAREIINGLKQVRKEGWILKEEEMTEKRKLKNMKDTYVKCDICNRGVFVKK